MMPPGTDVVHFATVDGEGPQMRRSRQAMVRNVAGMLRPHTRCGLIRFPIQFERARFGISAQAGPLPNWCRV